MSEKLMSKKDYEKRTEKLEKYMRKYNIFDNVMSLFQIYMVVCLISMSISEKDSSVVKIGAIIVAVFIIILFIMTRIKVYEAYNRVKKLFFHLEKMKDAEFEEIVKKLGIEDYSEYKKTIKEAEELMLDLGSDLIVGHNLTIRQKKNIERMLEKTKKDYFK